MVLVWPLKHDFAQSVKKKGYPETCQSGPELTMSIQALTTAQVACSNYFEVGFFKC